MHVMMESERGETRWRRRERSSSSERLTQREGAREERARESERERQADKRGSRQLALKAQDHQPPQATPPTTRERDRESYRREAGNFGAQRTTQIRPSTRNFSATSLRVCRRRPSRSPSRRCSSPSWSRALGRASPPLTRLVAHSDRTALLARVSHKIPPPSYDDDYRRNITFTSHTAAVAV